MRSRLRLLFLSCAIFVSGPTLFGQQILQNGFEARGPFWKPGPTDADVKILEHRLTEESAHGGQRCEYIRLQVGKGNFINYTYDLPRGLINEELNLSLWVRSNRPGIQLLCRMVLPRERDPNDPSKPLTVNVRCEPYQSTRWKPLNLPQPLKRLREQQQLLTRSLGREIVSSGAYIDQLILNVYAGPGLTEVWVDDLEVGPVEDTRSVLPSPTPQSVTAPGGTQTPGMLTGPGSLPITTTPRRAAEVQLRANNLFVSGKRFFLRGVRHTGAPPLRFLRDAGFNTVWMDESTPPGLLEEAANLGFWVVPTITPNQQPPGTYVSSEGKQAAAEEFARQVSRFLEQDAVLAWDLGSNLGAERFNEVARLAGTFRSVDPHRPVMADVWDGYGGYSINLSPIMLGTHRWPLMTSLELPAYRDWLLLRRRLAADGYCWTWIQTHLPDWFLELNQDSVVPEKPQPMGPQPDQIRLLAYTALSAGYRGLAFWSDRYLSDSHQGKDRLLAMALLNQELAMLERFLVQVTEGPDWIDTSVPEVKAAVFRAPEGILVLPMWVGRGAQFVPGQCAAPVVAVTVPGVPVTATAWEINPGRMQAYPIHRDVGGSTVHLRNFNLTSAILFTSNLSPAGPIVPLQDMQRRLGKLAAQWLHDQAREEMNKVEKVHEALNRLGHGLPDGNALLKSVNDALQRCMQHRRNNEYTEAYNQAELAHRLLRTYMRAHWERAIRDLDTPVATPHAVSFFTLPRHWQMLDRMKTMRPGRSVLPDGDFELDPYQQQTGWLLQEVPSLDKVLVTVRRVDSSPRAGKQCLMMRVQPREPQNAPLALERTYVALHTPAVKLAPGTLVRISVWTYIPEPITASTDGALFFDSIGGEPLAVRLTDPTPTWKKFSLYRRVPALGKVSVTLGMAGMGTVYFDDVRIEPLVPASPEVPVAAAD